MRLPSPVLLWACRPWPMFGRPMVDATQLENGLDTGITSVILRSMKTAISIPDQLFRAVELAAERLVISRSELFQRAVGEYLRNHQDKGVTKALDDVYGEAGIKSSLDPFLERLQIASLPEDEW